MSDLPQAAAISSSPRADLADYTLAWPRDIFAAVAGDLLSDPYMLGTSGGPDDVVEVLVQEAFVDGDHLTQVLQNETWRDELPTEWLSAPVRFDQGQLLRTLVAHVDELPAVSDRRYWSERRTGTTPTLSTATVRSQFVAIVEDLNQRGYFDKHMPKGCVDEAGSAVDPNDVLTQLLGRNDLWPLRSADPVTIIGSAPPAGTWDADTLFDLIEVFHDLAARPRTRGRWHNWNNCGWHFGDFDRRAGQWIYGWRVNDLLARSDLPYRLADAGEDLGRLVAVTDDGRAELEATMAARTDPETGDPVRHALALFRARAATEHDKRSAIITLAGVLEARRKLLKAELFRGDEGALFNIANNFAIRHQDESQKRDYDPVFLDWVFWWYLATIELTDRLIARHPRATGGAAS